MLGVDGHEVELLGHALVLAQDPGLVAAERVEDVAAELQVHAGFPVVHTFGLEHARHQVLHVDLQIHDEVGHDGEAEELARPFRVGAHDGIAGERGVHVAVGDHDESSAQRRDDLVLEPVREIGGIEQTEGGDVELVTGLGLVDGFGQAAVSGSNRC